MNCYQWGCSVFPAKHQETYLIFFNNSCFPFRILPHIVGNIGFVFTSAELVEIRDTLLSNKKEAPPRLMPLLLWTSLSPLVTQVKVQKNHLSFKLWLFQPKLLKEPLVCNFPHRWFPREVRGLELGITILNISSFGIQDPKLWLHQFPVRLKKQKKN